MADWRAAVDIGGTFTDVVLLDGDSGRVVVDKTLSTPARPLEGVTRGMLSALRRAGIEPRDVRAPVVHATTLVTNALIEGKVARAALVTNEGFGDTLLIRNEHRYDMYDLQIEFPDPPILQGFHVYLIQGPVDGCLVLAGQETRKALLREKPHGHDLPHGSGEIGVPMCGFLGHVPDPLPLGELGQVFPQENDPPRGWLQDPQDNADKGRFARPVGADQGHKIARGYGEGDVLDDLQAVKAVGNVFNRYERVTGVHSLIPCVSFQGSSPSARERLPFV